ncbi:MAG: IS481 family transposase [Rhizobiales bacterium]|nr:IS481 family transposase [Hyphomicrobiales bacterium]
MNIHKNARLTPIRRAEMAISVIEGRLSKAQAAEVYGVSSKVVSRWVERYKALGIEGMTDRSSRPHRLNRPTPDHIVQRIIDLRRQRLTGKHIAREVCVSPATVSRVLQRAGLSRLKDLEPKQPERRYQYNHPGDMIHLDIKKFGRFERPGHRVTGDRTGQSNPRSGAKNGYGWEYLHVCIDDASRIAFTDIYPDEKKQSAVAFLKAAIDYYRRLGITITRVMTDNGSCYKSFAFRDLCKQLGLRHIRTKPYTPRTNGKAERFIKTAITEWAYAMAYQTSKQRADYLPKWTHMYNWHRPHGGIKYQTPISVLCMNRDNLLRFHN